MAQGELGLAEAVRSGLGGMVRYTALARVRVRLRAWVRLSSCCISPRRYGARPNSYDIYIYIQVRDLGMLGSLLPPRALRQDLAVLRDSASPTDVQQGALG